jgi:hypothetical protein
MRGAAQADAVVALKATKDPHARIVFVSFVALSAGTAMMRGEG